MQRTKALGLLYKQIRKDNTMNRVGMPDYMLFFLCSGDNLIGSNIVRRFQGQRLFSTINVAGAELSMISAVALCPDCGEAWKKSLLLVSTIPRKLSK